MREILYSAIVIIIIHLVFQRCASPGMVTGGPKDTIPPKLIQSYPPSGSTNYKDQEFIFVFDERINADQMKNKLLITPFIDNPLKFKVKKEQLTINFDNPFADSTTYIFNFAEGVGDLTEKNPVENFKLAFSTTNFIDSLHISGKIVNITDNQPVKKYIVSLYQSDTASVFKHKPTYFTYTDDEGNFILENLKSTKYRIYTFNDENKNLLLEPKKEALGFLSDTIHLKEKIDSIKIRTILIDATPLTFTRKGMNGQYYEMKYSKHLYKYTIEKLIGNDTTPTTSLIDDNTSIRFYNVNNTYQDSNQYIITTYDSLGNTSIDTAYVKFQTGNRKADEFKIKSLPVDKSNVFDSIRIVLSTNKPIHTYRLDTIIISVTNIEFKLPLKNNGTMKIDANKSNIIIKLPTLSRTVSNWRDSTIIKIKQDSINYTDEKLYTDTLLVYKNLPVDNYAVNFKKGTFMSIEGDSSETIKINLIEPNKDQFGSVKGKISTKETFYIIELIDKTGKTIQSLTTPRDKYEFKNVRQGTFSFRVKIGNPETKTWNYGNILKNIAPDKTYFYEKTFEIRPNWEVENVDISF